MSEWRARPLHGWNYLKLLELADEGHTDEVLSILDEYLAANQDRDKDGSLTGNVLSQKALFSAQAERWTEAIELYRQALVYTNKGGERSGLARVLAETGDFDASIRVLDDALASPVDLYEVLGLLWNYAHISDAVGTEIPERYRELFRASCDAMGMKLSPEELEHTPLRDAILIAHRKVREAQESRS